MSPRTALIPAVAAACLLVSACDRAPLTGPPELHLGRDECAECGMLINEDRCSAALVVEAPPSSGRRRHLLYDDIGCLLDAELSRDAEFTIIERYVRDHAERTWHRAESAAYVIAPPDRLPTPMGSGMVAFKQRAAAEAAAAAAGESADYAGLLNARRRWWDSRKAESAPRR